MVFLKNDKIVVGPVQANRVFAAKHMRRGLKKMARGLPGIRSGLHRFIETGGV